MNFTPDNCDKVFAEKDPKTQTRRLNDRYTVGKDYAVCPGRGKLSIGRIKILRKWQEPVHDISGKDCWAEGIRLYSEDPQHGHVFVRYPFGDAAWDYRWAYRDLWISIHKKPGTRWQDNPTVWCYEFEVVKRGR